MAKFDAAKKDFRTAYELTQRYGEAVALPRPSGSSSLEELQQRYVSNPDNYGIGYALYREQMQRGRLDDALVTLRHFSERPKSPPYFRFLEAQGWAAKQDWERAWTAWLAYHDAAKK
jgi:Flp pilus assembly protein TadD